MDKKKVKYEYEVIMRTKSDADRTDGWGGWSNLVSFNTKKKRDEYFKTLKKDILKKNKLINFGGIFIKSNEIHSIWRINQKYIKNLFGWGDANPISRH